MEVFNNILYVIAAEIANLRLKNYLFSRVEKEHSL